jgi:LysM repeat protein
MSGSWLGLTAILIFSFLVIFFLATVTATSEAIVRSGSSAVGAVTAPVLVQAVAISTNTPSVIPINEQSSSATYTVQPGDWLNSIARQYNTTAQAILAANPEITDPDTIRPGQVLVIPSP